MNKILKGPHGRVLMWGLHALHTPNLDTERNLFAYVRIHSSTFTRAEIQCVNLFPSSMLSPVESVRYMMSCAGHRLSCKELLELQPCEALLAAGWKFEWKDMKADKDWVKCGSFRLLNASASTMIALAKHYKQGKPKAIPPPEPPFGLAIPVT